MMQQFGSTSPVIQRFLIHLMQPLLVSSLIFLWAFFFNHPVWFTLPGAMVVVGVAVYFLRKNQQQEESKLIHPMTSRSMLDLATAPPEMRENRGVRPHPSTHSTESHSHGEDLTPAAEIHSKEGRDDDEDDDDEGKESLEDESEEEEDDDRTNNEAHRDEKSSLEFTEEEDERERRRFDSLDESFQDSLEDDEISLDFSEDENSVMSSSFPGVVPLFPDLDKSSGEDEDPSSSSSSSQSGNSSSSLSSS
jgi:hypothetical protein